MSRDWLSLPPAASPAEGWWGQPSAGPEGAGTCSIPPAPAQRRRWSLWPAAGWRQGLDSLLATAFSRRSEGAGPWDCSTRVWEAEPGHLSTAAGARLESARRAYAEVLQDLPADALREDAPGLSVDLQLTTSMSDLWALRPAVFGVLARRFTQAEAQARLERLDARFPPPRSASRPAAPRASSRRGRRDATRGSATAGARTHEPVGAPAQAPQPPVSPVTGPRAV